jgi:hypothetical protein
MKKKKGRNNSDEENGKDNIKGKAVWRENIWGKGYGKSCSREGWGI